MKKVLFICTWGVGNMIQTTPTLQAIHDLDYKIEIYTNPVFKDQYDLLKGWKVIDHIWLHPTGPDFSAYDYLVYHHPARSESHWSKYKEVMGSDLAEKVIQNLHPDPFWPGEIHANLELAVKLGRNPFEPDTPKCHIECDEFKYPHKYEKNIVLSPTTHENDKLWGPKYWLHWDTFIKSLASSNPDWLFWIVGAENDVNKPPELKWKNLRNVIGKFDIRTVASLIKRADLVLCNETGVGWIADALDTPCLTLWTCTNMVKNWVQSKKRIVAFKNVCQFQPCHHQTRIPGMWCPYIRSGQKHACGYSFTQEQIWPLMVKMLGEK